MVDEDSTQFQYLAMHEQLAATVLVVEFHPQAADIRVTPPTAFHALRFDTIGSVMYTKFPTWRQAALYHHHICSQINHMVDILAIRPIPMENRVYEVYVEEAKQQARAEDPLVTVTTTFIDWATTA